MIGSLLILRLATYFEGCLKNLCFGSTHFMQAIRQLVRVSFGQKDIFIITSNMVFDLATQCLNAAVRRPVGLEFGYSEDKASFLVYVSAPVGRVSFPSDGRFTFSDTDANIPNSTYLVLQVCCRSTLGFDNLVPVLAKR